MKNIPKRRVSANLFDNIHTILEDPHHRGASESSKVSKLKMQELYSKIKLINQKLGVKDHLPATEGHLPTTE